MFHIKEFYPSIKKKLLWEAIRFVKRCTSITSTDTDAIFHTRKSLISDCNRTRTHNHLIHKRKLNHLAKLAAPTAPV